MRGRALAGTMRRTRTVGEGTHRHGHGQAIPVPVPMWAGPGADAGQGACLVENIEEINGEVELRHIGSEVRPLGRVELHCPLAAVEDVQRQLLPQLGQVVMQLQRVERRMLNACVRHQAE